MGRPTCFWAARDETRYLAVSAAHITHLLRDTLEDIQAGYFNIPREYLAAKGIGPQDVESEAYRAWVQERANLARACFKSGKEYLAQVKNIRCRIAGYAYVSSFERVLEAIERLDFRLVPESMQNRGPKSGDEDERIGALAYLLFADTEMIWPICAHLCKSVV